MGVIGTRMGQVDLDFKPSVPVFDANVAVGRRHDRVVREETVEGTLEAMKQAGVGRALVYGQHAATFDPSAGNELLMEMIGGEPSLVPQLVCNPSYDDLAAFAAGALERRVRSVRMLPRYSDFPFRGWVVRPWLTWLAAEKIPLWLPAEETDPGDLHDTIAQHPDVNIVLCEVHYRHVPWALPLLRSLSNVYVELSRFVISDGMARLLDAVGHRRILYGSRFPDAPMAPNLYMLHRCGLAEEVLRDICADNLRRLLGES